jgi:hypothetical protein
MYHKDRKYVNGTCGLLKYSLYEKLFGRNKACNGINIICYVLLFNVVSFLIIDYKGTLLSILCGVTVNYDVIVIDSCVSL